MNKRVRMPQVSMVLTVGNAEEAVGNDVRKLIEHLSELGLSHEIVAVNDGSRDNSFALLALLTASTPALRLLPGDTGGRPFIRGVAEARGELVIFLEAGRPSSLAALGWAVSRLQNNKDCVVLRGRFIAARRMPTLSIVARLRGRGAERDRDFERLAASLRLEVFGVRPRSSVALWFQPVLRFLAA